MHRNRPRVSYPARATQFASSCAVDAAAADNDDDDDDDDDAVAVATARVARTDEPEYTSSSIRIGGAAGGDATIANGCAPRRQSLTRVRRVMPMFTITPRAAPIATTATTAHRRTARAQASTHRRGGAIVARAAPKSSKKTTPMNTINYQPKADAKEPWWPVDERTVRLMTHVESVSVCTNACDTVGETSWVVSNRRLRREPVVHRARDAARRGGVSVAFRPDYQQVMSARMTRRERGRGARGTYEL